MHPQKWQGHNLVRIWSDWPRGRCFRSRLHAWVWTGPRIRCNPYWTKRMCVDEKIPQQDVPTGKVSVNAFAHCWHALTYICYVSSTRIRKFKATDGKEYTWSNREVGEYEWVVSAVYLLPVYQLKRYISAWTAALISSHTTAAEVSVGLVSNHQTYWLLRRDARN